MAEEKRSKKPRIEYEWKNDSETGYDWMEDPLYDSLLIGDNVKPFICETMKKGDILIKLVDLWKQIEIDPTASKFTRKMLSYILKARRVQITVGQLTDMIEIIRRINSRSIFAPIDHYLEKLNNMHPDTIVQFPFDNKDEKLLKLLSGAKHKDTLYRIINVLTKEQLCQLYRLTYKRNLIEFF